MSKRLALAGLVALSLLTVASSIGRAQSAPRITVEWQRAPLNQVLEALATFSGRTIVTASDVRGQDVSVAFDNVEWPLVLAAVLQKQGLVARVDSSSVIRIEKQTSAKITVEWQDAPLSRVIEAFAKFSGRTIVLATNVTDGEVTAAFHNLDWQLVLNAILDKQVLVAREDMFGVIHIEKR